MENGWTTAASEAKAAEKSAIRRLLNAYLRESGIPDPRIRSGVEESTPEGGVVGNIPGEPFSLDLNGKKLYGYLIHYSPSGHHRYADLLRADRGKGWEQVTTAVELARFLLEDGLPNEGPERKRLERFLAQVRNSVEKTALYLRKEAERGHPRRVWRPDLGGKEAEQALTAGHPFHPTPKSSEGFQPEDLKQYAPEMGASFRLHYLAVHPSLLEEERLPGWEGEPVPDEVRESASGRLNAGQRDFGLLPLHPWQARHLLQQPWFSERVREGSLVDLGPLGEPVYPTSSVRTVCHPGRLKAWKLPLRVRITHFFRTNPPEHIRRTLDAGVYVSRCRRGWSDPGFGVLLDWGCRRIGARAEDTAVLFREHPFPEPGPTPWVVASLLEERQGEEPWLVQIVRRAGGGKKGPLSPAWVRKWLKAYLRIAFKPVLHTWIRDGISLEAHVQNCLVEVEENWPVRFWVRDMEGVSVSRDRLPKGAPIPPESPVLYGDEEAWKRLKYYAVTNHLGHLIHVLAFHGGIKEQRLWGDFRDSLIEWRKEWTEDAARYVDDLLHHPHLPAKANLVSRLHERGERPDYVMIPNPIREVNGRDVETDRH
ncbi:siderophore synthetase component [Melghirimyces profundicolus]|uniref:Siderophore synthetase component n=1 Tax=Melghirimyces profundicolus TaxID=1242148 RepID=A0A2T6C8P4_9BACL|nr:IucA/IucC family protein [Melghirimyces profundicolus]PTX64687.1 siderophore synthetase component [Melghirimyces profundicolus]